MPKPVFTPVAMLLALALLITACGGNGSSGSGGDPVKIALIANLTGGVSNNPEYGDGAEAAVKAINAKGGIKGRPLELTVCDNHQNATDSANCYRKILADKDIVAIAGGADIYRDANKAQLEAAKLPIIGQYPVGNFDLSNPLAFNLNGATAVGFNGLALDVASGGAKRVGLVTLDIPTADIIRHTVGDALAKAGVDIVSNVQVSPTAVDFGAPAQQVIQEHPDAVIWLTLAPQTGVAINALRQAGYHGTVAIAGPSFDRPGLESMGTGGPLTVGLVLPPAWDTSTRYGQRFNAEMKTYAPGAKITENSLNSWLGVQVFAQTAATLPTVDRASVLDGLKRMSKVDTGGLTPPISFAAASALPWPAVFNPAYTIVHVRNGKADWDGKLHEFGTHRELQPTP